MSGINEVAPAGDGADGPIETFTAAEQAGDDEDAAPIGTVEAYADGHLVVTEGDPARLDFLVAAVERVNAKQSVVLKSTDPQAEPGTVGAVSVSRGDPAFVNAARNWLRTYYGLVLS